MKISLSGMIKAAAVSAVVLAHGAAVLSPAMAQEGTADFIERADVSAADPFQAEGSAADDPMQDRLLGINIQQAFEQRLKMTRPDVTPAQVGSILYTPWQHALLQEAKVGFTTRSVDNLRDLERDPNEPRKKGPREVSIGGIVYGAPMEWTVWLNGQRIAPDALPEQIIDIKVAKDYVDLKWYDSYTNLIYPIRLRAHERFNLDSRIFLPGAGKL